MLHVHRAERADRLLAALAEVLAEPSADPLTPELISVHSRGIERWIAQELASVLGTGRLGGDGICANVEFPFPARLVRGAVAAGSGVDPVKDPWLPERLTWPLLELVQDHAENDMLGPLRSHLGGEAPDPERLGGRFGAVRHVADLFDRYGVHRPEMVWAWRRGQDIGPDGGGLQVRHRWQPWLWRALRERVGLESFAERVDYAIRTIRADPDRLELPPRLALFGLTAIPATYLAIVAAIAAHRAVHLLLLHPSPELWARVSAVTGASRQWLWNREDDPTRELPRNPLLSSWGRDVRELQLVIPNPPEAHHRHHHQPPQQLEASTLLERIQADVRANLFPGRTPRAGEDDHRPLLEPYDLSLQVHDCHGRLRQVEVLRDAILHLLVDKPDLELRDIIVKCPDIEAFAPLVTAVFGSENVSSQVGHGGARLDGAPPALRVRLADRSIRATNPVLEVVAAVLELADGRMSSLDVLDLLSHEPVRRRLGFQGDEVELLESWVADLQIRWGLDGAHRRREGLPDLDANTWRAGLERLKLGIAMADEDLRLIEGVAPYDGVEGQTSDLAGRLIELIERLAAISETMRAPQPISAWRDAIGAGADALTMTGPDTAWQRVQLHGVLDDVVDEATSDRTASSVELSLGEVRVLLADRLEGRPSSTSHRTGDLTVCTLVPMRSVPHRVVCLLGLDDGTFPRQGVPDSDDLLQESPRVGDRDARFEDRQLLLDALMAATETLVVTYSGRDERTNEDRPPAVPVDELLDVVDRTVRTRDGRRPREAITIRHPLQEHDPRSFEPGRFRPDNVAWSFDPAGLAAARIASNRTHASPPPFLARELTLPEQDTIELDDLVAFLQHPVKEFVRQRLEVTLPSADEQPSAAIPSTLQGLEAWRVGEDLLQAWRAGHDLERAEEVISARGLVPPGHLAATDLAAVRAGIDHIIRLCGRLGIGPGSSGRVDVQVLLPDGRTLTGVVPDVAGCQVQTVGYATLSAKHRLAAWARLVAITTTAPDTPWQAVTVGRHSYSRKRRQQLAQAAVLPPLAQSPSERKTAATSHLLRLIDLFDRGRRAPIPLYCNTSLKAAEQLQADRSPRRNVDYAWESRDHRGRTGENRDPYHLLVLGQQLSTDELFEERCRELEERSWADHDSRFVAYAWRLWEPILAAQRLREA
ncbi:MAG: exodeoxyribonuclease V subunit gamma [Nitriliruptorales bacterium]